MKTLYRFAGSASPGPPARYLPMPFCVILFFLTPWLCGPAYGQPVAYHFQGKVLSATANEPLPGASVQLKGTRQGTTTDAEGAFTFGAADSRVTLRVSFIGYHTLDTLLQLPLTRELLLALKPDEAMLKEVTVSTGYWESTKRLSTGNISKVTAETIEKQPVSNPLAAMIGRMPGVQITQNSGVPGGAFSIQIRGRNSIASGNDPLYVIDGVPYISDPLSSSRVTQGILGSKPGGSTLASPLDHINLGDIERIEVLKDADATAIYGSRGANGVVLITTKRGQSGKIKVNFGMSVGQGKVAGRVKLLDTPAYLQMREEAFANDGIMPGPGHYDVNGTWARDRSTDWQQVLLGGTAGVTRSQLTISGGSGTTQFSLSGSFQKEGLVFPGDFNARKYSGHLSLQHMTTNKRFKATASVGYTGNRSDMLESDLTLQAFVLPPNAPAIYDQDGKLNWENATWWNPLSYLEQRYTSRTGNLVANAMLNYELFPELQIKANIGINDMVTRERLRVPSTFFSPVNNPTPADSYLRHNNAGTWSLIFEPQISWTKHIGGTELSVLGGFSYQSRDRQGLAQEFKGFSTNSLIGDPRSAFTSQVLDNIDTRYRYVAVFGRINYNLKNRYLLNVTARRDGSSRFGPEQRFATFGAVGAAWIFSEENWSKSFPSWLSFGKLTVSFGSSGNDQIGDYRYLDTYSSSGVYQQAAGLIVTKLFNPDYAWEVNKKLESGIDLGFFNDRFQLSIAFFRNRSSNQLINYPLPTTTGFGSIIRNLSATVQNTGQEYELSAGLINKGDFRWTSSVNMTLPRNKLISFPHLEQSSYANQYVVGKSLSVIKQYHWIGVNSETGYHEFADLNGDGLVSTADRLVITETGQRLYGGIGNTLHYKRLQIDIFMQVVKRRGRSFEDYAGAAPGNFVNQPAKVMEERWRNPGDTALRQRLTTQYSQTFAYNMSSDASNRDISFLRLKNVAISYRLPLGKDKTVRIYVNGQNLLTLTKYDGLDAENSGIGMLPPLRTLTTGFQFEF